MPGTKSWIKKQIRLSDSNCNTTTRARAPLNPPDFTAHVCTKLGEVTMVAPKYLLLMKISKRTSRARLTDFRTGLRQGATESIMSGKGRIKRNIELSNCVVVSLWKNSSHANGLENWASCPHIREG